MLVIQQSILEHVLYCEVIKYIDTLGNKDEEIEFVLTPSSIDILKVFNNRNYTILLYKNKENNELNVVIRKLTSCNRKYDNECIFNGYITTLDEFKQVLKLLKLN